MSKDKGIDQKLIRDLATILNVTNLSEIEIEQEDLRIRVVRHITIEKTSSHINLPNFSNVTSSDTTLQNHTETAQSKASISQESHNITSPIVGTAYHAAEPGAKPFVQIGDTIKEGQTVMIIEAMKHMNHIHADRSGKVVQIFVEDGQPVEYGEPLLAIE